MTMCVAFRLRVWSILRIDNAHSTGIVQGNVLDDLANASRLPKSLINPADFDATSVGGGEGNKSGG